MTIYMQSLTDYLQQLQPQQQMCPPSDADKLSCACNHISKCVSSVANKLSCACNHSSKCVSSVANRLRCACNHSNKHVSCDADKLSCACSQGASVSSQGTPGCCSSVRGCHSSHRQGWLGQTGQRGHCSLPPGCEVQQSSDAQTHSGWLTVLEVRSEC